MKGLDIGTAFIVCMEQDHTGKQIIRSERDAFFEVPSADFTKNMLNESEVNYVKLKDKLYVIGDRAMEFAEVFGNKARRPLARGYISPREREALPILRQILGAVLGTRRENDETVVFSAPSDTVDDIQRQNALLYHRESLALILRSLGYNPVPINEALAIIYSELKSYQFSGIAISFGAGLANICATWLSVPIPELTFAIGRGGDWIDEQVANVLDESVAVVCGMKESKSEFNLADTYTSGIPQALSLYYRELMKYVIMHLERAFYKMKRRFPTPIPIVIAGGTTMPRGFLHVFKEYMKKCVFSNAKGDKIEIGDIIQAQSLLYAVAKGCLIKGIIG